ncbi:MAG: penicillin-binding protein [Actinomycetes bacterium]
MRRLHAPRAVAGLLALGLLAGACGDGARPAEAVRIPANSEPSAIFDARGRLITVLRRENRIPVQLRSVPRVAQDAVVAIEDARFWSHRGVDPKAIARAASRNAQTGGVAEGGSTITQQYVKNALLTPERSLRRKVEEASLALSLERTYSKEFILEQYLNTIYFGGGAYGIEAAAQSFFGRPAAQLDLAQSALLAGLVRSPSYYDPRRNPQRAVDRRATVLRRMVELGLVTEAQRTFADATPLQLVPPQPLPEQLPYPAAHFVDAVKDWLLRGTDALGTTQAERFDKLYRGGLRINTTIDLDLQAQAERSIREVVGNQGVDPRAPDAALVSVEPRTGHVKAMVGGYNYFGSHAYRQTNLARGSGRQTGSSFKPIVLATALGNGVSTSRRFPAPAATTLRIPGGVWKVKGGGIGSGTLEECTVVSSNTCYANVILDKSVGPQRAIETAQRLGVVHTDLQANPAAVLGTNNATFEDMASVYATFANSGVHVDPTYVTSVTAGNGDVLYAHSPVQSKAIEPEVARQVSGILEQAVLRGTGKDAALDRPTGGKTGSAQRNTDAWFCGYVPQLATAVWVGFAQPRADRSGRRELVPMTAPNTRITVFGGTYPAEIWRSFMQGALAATPPLPLVDALAPALPPTTTVPPASPSATAPVPAADRSTVRVPVLAGLSPTAARARLRSAGLAAQQVDTDVPGAVPDQIVAQSPAAGSAVRPGSTVWFEVVGPPPTTTTTAPPPLVPTPAPVPGG